MPQHRTRRTHVHASVFGGVFDDEFAVDSQTFFEQASAGRFHLLTSALVADELMQAPFEVRECFDREVRTAELIPVDEAALVIQAAYLETGILTSKWSDDALHVALASVAGVDLIVSWNFRHIVHVDKVSRYNAVNVLHGYSELAIHSPSEVIDYEDGEEI